MRVEQRCDERCSPSRVVVQFETIPNRLRGQRESAHAEADGPLPQLAQFLAISDGFTLADLLSFGHAGGLRESERLRADFGRVGP